MEKGGSFGSADALQERRKKKGALPLAVFLSFNDKDVHPHCPNACNPYHKCGRYCLDKIPSGNKLLDGLRSEGSSSEWEKVLERKEVNPNSPNASTPCHKCTKNCSEKITEKHQDAVKEPVQVRGEKKVQRKCVTPISLNALNYFHKYAEYCIGGCSTSYSGKNKGIPITADISGVNPNCKYASNPYHRCDEFCFEKSPGSDHPKGVMKPKEQKLVHTAEREVNPKCKNSSNPYHVCAEYCFQEVLEMGSPGQGMKLKKLKERKKVASNTPITGVNPHCRFASNPYHKCAEYCFQNGAEKDISDGVTKFKKGMKAAGDAERRNGKPMCENASNPYHTCSDNCFQSISGDNPAVEAPIKGKKEVPRKERKADHPVKEKWSMDSNGIESSDSFEGIAIHDGSNESESVFIKEEKEVEASMVELLDTQPLRIDAIDLFQEWAKYCSLKATEDNEAKTAKTGQRKKFLDPPISIEDDS